MASTAKAYRLRVRNAADSADDFIISSLIGDSNLYIEDPPKGDGQKVNVLTGNVDVGTYSVNVIDTGVAPVNAVTAKLYDATLRIALLNRRAYNEININGAGWTNLSAGYISAIKLADPGLFVFSIGDTRRIEQSFELFRSIIKTNIDGTETLQRLNRATSFIGGPVEGGFAATRDWGAWKFRVEEKYAGTTIVRLRFEYGWYPTDHGYRAVSGVSNIPITEMLRLQTALRPYQVPDGKYWNQLQVRYSYPRVRAKIFNESGALLGMVPVYGSRGNPSHALGRGDLLVDWAAAPALTTKVYVYLLPVDISVYNPLHLNGHPADIIGDMWADSGIPYDPASVVSSRTIIGPDIRVGLRYTAPQKLVDVERVIFGLFGLGTRIDASGRRIMFSTRVKSASAPALVVTYADMREDIPELFNTSEAQIVNRVIVNQKGFQEWSNDAEDFWIRPIDGDYFNHMDFVVDVPQSAEVVYEDPTSYGIRDVTYALEGYIYSAKAQSGLGYLPNGTGLPVDLYARSIAGEIFDRFGRGPVEIPFKFHDSFTGQLGDEFVLNVPHFPNSGNARGGTRIFQVVQRTETPDGPDVSALDAGANVQPATAPTFTIAANAAQPRNVVDLVITNAATLAAAGLKVRVQMAVQGIAPTDDGSPLGFLDPAVYPNLSTPAVDGGSTVYFKMRSEFPGQRAGAWTAWQSITLTALPTVTGLSTTLVSPTEYDLAWTNNDAAGLYLVDVLARATATEVTRVIDTLPPGSTKYRLNLKENSTAYDYGVRLRERPPLNGVSATVTNAVVTGVKTSLNAPTNARAFAGAQNNVSLSTMTGIVAKIDGTYGMDVDATEIPSATEFWMAVETAVGSGVAGTYELLSSMPSNATGKTFFTAIAPNDGRLRYMYARHVLEHRDPSPASTIVSVIPWVSTSPVDEAIPTPADFMAAAAFAIGERGEEARLRLTFTPPSVAHFARMVYNIQSRPAGSSAAFGAGTFVVGSKTGPDLIPAQFSTEYQITPYTETLGTHRQTVGTPVNLTVAARTDPTPAYGTPIATSGYIEYPAITYDTETKYIEVWSRTFTTAPDTSSVENATGAALVTTLNKGDGRSLIQLAVDATNQYRKTTFIPYDKDDNRGPVTTFVTQRATPATPAAPASASNTSNPNPGTGSITNRVTLGVGAVAGWSIRTYRGGVAYGSDRSLVSADITAGYVDIMDSGASPGTTYSYTYSTLNATGIESTTTTAALSVTTFGATLPAPHIVSVVKSSGFHTVSWTDATAPSGVTYYVESEDNLSGFWVYQDDTTGFSSIIPAQMCPNSRRYRVYATKTGWTSSAPSALVAGACT